MTPTETLVSYAVIGAWVLLFLVTIGLMVATERWVQRFAADQWVRDRLAQEADPKAGRGGRPSRHTGYVANFAQEVVKGQVPMSVEEMRVSSKS